MNTLEDTVEKPGGIPLLLKNAAVFLLSAGVVVLGLHYSRVSLAVTSGGARVLVASQELIPGKIVTSADVNWQGLRPPRGVTPINFDGARHATLVGSIVAIHVPAGQVIPASALTPAGDGNSIASAIAAGRSAVTVPAERIGSGVALLAPGDRVDVLLATDPNKLRQLAGKNASTADYGSTLIVRDARVLNVAPPLRRDTGRNAGRSVTLDLSLDEAQKVAIGLTAGTLHFALRSGQGSQEGDLAHMTTISQLLPPGFGSAAEPPAKAQVTVIQGRRSQSVEVRR